MDRPASVPDSDSRCNSPSRCQVLWDVGSFIGGYVACNAMREKVERKPPFITLPVAAKKP